MTKLPIFKSLTCPTCRRRAYVVCSTRSCACWREIPKGKRPLRWTRGDGLRCPYCRFAAHADYWEDRSMERTDQAQVADPAAPEGAEQGKVTDA
jgi:DNA-directed RNA polymerase subunit RPC12/RpoP